MGAAWVAAVTKEEAERSHRQAEFAKALGNYEPRFKKGEIVIITEERPEYRGDDQIIVPGRHKSTCKIPCTSSCMSAAVYSWLSKAR